MSKKNKLVEGWGVNDADYAVTRYVSGKLVLCPFYRRWCNMLRRSHSAAYVAQNPTYADCTISDEWRSFMAFRSWMIQQDWDGKQLDKDICVPNNKRYSPETCRFISPALNLLLNDNAAARGDLPRGVAWNKRTRKYHAKIKINGTQKHLGYFAHVGGAAIAYRIAKSAEILRQRDLQTDPAIRHGLAQHAHLVRYPADEPSYKEFDTCLDQPTRQNKSPAQNATAPEKLNANASSKASMRTGHTKFIGPFTLFAKIATATARSRND